MKTQAEQYMGIVESLKVVDVMAIASSLDALTDYNEAGTIRNDWTWTFNDGSEVILNEDSTFTVN